MSVPNPCIRKGREAVPISGRPLIGAPQGLRRPADSVFVA